MRVCRELVLGVLRIGAGCGGELVLGVLRIGAGCGGELLRVC